MQSGPPRGPVRAQATEATAAALTLLRSTVTPAEAFHRRLALPIGLFPPGKRKKKKIGLKL